MPGSVRTAARPGPPATSTGPPRASASFRWPRPTGTTPTRCRRRAAPPAAPASMRLRTTKTYVVTPETLRQLRAVKEALEAPGKACEIPPSEVAHRKQAEAKANEELTVLGTQLPRRRADGRPLRDEPHRSRGDPAQRAAGQAALRPARRHDPLPRHGSRLRGAGRFPAGARPGPRSTRARGSSSARASTG